MKNFMGKCALIDTCVLSDVINDKQVPAIKAASKQMLQQLASAHLPLAINNLIYAELMFLVRDRQKLDHFLSATGIRVSLTDLEDAGMAGEMCAVMGEKHGAWRGTKHMVDFIIAAHARRVGQLITRDRDDFEPLCKMFKIKVQFVTPTE